MGARLRSSILCLVMLGWLLPSSASVAEEGSTARDVRARIEQEVRARVGAVDRIELPELRRLTHRVDPQGLRIEAEATGPLRRDRLGIRVSLWRSDQLVRRGVVTAKLHAVRKVVVAARDLRARDRISEADITVMERPIGEVDDDAEVLVGDVVGLRLRRSLRQGQSLRGAFLESVPDVARGERVKLLFKSGALRIDAVGLSQEDGRRGELIRVLNPKSRREVVGRVIDVGVVHVDL